MNAHDYINAYRNPADPERFATVALTDDLVVARDYSVTPLAIASIDELREIGLVWSVDRSTTPPVDVPWHHGAATRTTVGDAADLIDSTYAFRKPRVEAAGSTIGGEPLVFPAFRVSRSRPFLIDGCHRAVFIALNDLEVEIALDVLEGEVDEILLPDSTVPDASQEER